VVFLIGIAAVGFGYVTLAKCADSVSGDTNVTITTEKLPAGAVGVAYSQVVSATGGKGTYCWDKLYGSLPAGLTITDTGLIYGTPVFIGNSNFTVQATDSQNSAVYDTKTLSVTISPPGLAIIETTFPDGTVRAAYSHKVRAQGGFIPYNWSISAGSLPAGLSLDAKNGVISGRPTTAGVKQFTVKITDNQKPAAAATKNLSIKIESCILPRVWFSPIQ